MKAGSGYKTYDKLPNLYVITILNFDLFGADYMMYTFENKCVEVPELEYRDGLKFIYFNTKGHKGGSEEIRNLLRYIEDSSESNVTDETTSRMHEYVGRIKMLPEVRDAYMTWDMYIKMLEDDKFKEGKAAGEAEGKAEGELRLSNLIGLMIKDGKMSEIERVTTDKDYRNGLYEKYGI